MNRDHAPLVVSVIIPTYNRRSSLERTLASLRRQTLDHHRYEVIVVDDGSSDTSREIESWKAPFSFHYIRQEKKGATAARNYGASRSRGKVLVFVDDDIVIFPETLEVLAEECLRQQKSLVMGKIVGPSDLSEVASASPDIPSLLADGVGAENGHLHFTQCKTGLLAIRAEAFIALGMLQDPTGGWPNWDDVDLGYRAHREGYEVRLASTAVGVHWDESSTNLSKTCLRLFEASRSAVRLFERYPELQPQIPMFRDKLPIDLRTDSFRMILRKLARQLASSGPVLWVMENMAVILQSRQLPSDLLSPLHRWIVGGYILRGYRAGLRERRERRNPPRTGQTEA